jgi:hypothetical protein
MASPDQVEAAIPAMRERLAENAARARRFYWKRIRRHRYEICGSVRCESAAYRTIRRYGCGRPIGPLWRVPTPLWNYVVAGMDQTVLTVRPGAAVSDLAPRSEGVGGILCLVCFTRAAQARGLAYLMWRPEGSGDYAA